jgi:hypothetical protein
VAPPVLFLGPFGEIQNGGLKTLTHHAHGKRRNSASATLIPGIKSNNQYKHVWQARTYGSEAIRRFGIR